MLQQQFLVADPKTVYTSIFSGILILPILVLLCVYCLKKSKLFECSNVQRKKRKGKVNAENHSNTKKASQRRQTPKFAIPDLELMTVIEEDENTSRNYDFQVINTMNNE